MFEYQKTGKYFAQISDGLESLAAEELTSLGGTQVRPGYRGLHFHADRKTLYAIHYNTRLATRILTPLRTFDCRNRDDLYRVGKDIDWTELFSIHHTFAVSANVSGNEAIRHSKFAALCLKDAVADRFRQRCGCRPDVDARNPDVWLNLYIERNRATIYLDTSGGSLHRRGYRMETVTAPMPETLAAAVVAFSGWDGAKPLHDPLCGSATLLCEALMKVCRIPAGFLRKHFGCRFLPDFDKILWDQMKREWDEGIVPLPEGLIAGSDLDAEALNAARANCRMLPGGDSILFSRNDFRAIGNLENRVILCNPPYGLRMREEADLPGFYKELGDFLKQRCKGSEAYIYFGNREMLKCIGLKPAWKKPVRNADLDGRIAKYELY
ncbi:MAG: THUMP domain-containing class I SAM-dependent RNA methyltransferase [Thermodesulfobacteriota bacterium]